MYYIHTHCDTKVPSQQQGADDNQQRTNQEQERGESDGLVGDFRRASFELLESRNTVYSSIIPFIAFN